MTVLVDTSAILALVNPGDHAGTAAKRTMAVLQADGIPLLTHQYVTVEAFSLLQRRLGMWAARHFVSDLLPLFTEIWVDRDLHLDARGAALANDVRGISLVDWTSFVVMRRLGITTAFTFDADFATQGFAVLPGAD